ncbi:unnamed protein product, partial [Onchocerca flexuosa]|uniref:BESS domain-containing protein n=1 Tax=Onchocerca flexuosa TaxID=387005 RepID=A0A183I857_9BILA
IQQSFLHALNGLFSCARKKTSKTPQRRNRSHSWSPSYDGTGNFLSEEERRLRWAFRKNQPDFPSSETRRKKQFFSPVGEAYSIALKQKKKNKVAKCSCNYDKLARKKSSGRTSAFTICSSEQSTSSTMKPLKSENGGNTTYLTAPEYNTRGENGSSCSRNSSNTTYILSQEMESLKLGLTSLQVSSIKIPQKILAVVRQLSDERLKQELSKR